VGKVCILMEVWVNGSLSQSTRVRVIIIAYVSYGCVVEITFSVRHIGPE
jgi:hypothetical protein